jgi:S-formylglutathione hydrolase FrmB
MHKTVKSVVVLPASYDQSPEKRYPVVYLLHGHGGNYAAYVNQTRPQLPQDASNMEFIAVCPDGGRDSWYWDSPADPKNRYETFVASELVKYIDKHYRTKADRTGRAITGFSMGGHGALWLAFRHPETFGACGSMSGGVDIRPFPDQWGMKRWLGEYADHPKVWDDYTVATQLYRLRPEPHVLGGRSNDWLGKSEVRRPAIIIDCGTDDFFYGVNLALHEAMLHNNIAHTFIVRPGSHNHDYWRNALEYQLLFFHNYFDREAQPQ